MRETNVKLSPDELKRPFSVIPDGSAAQRSDDPGARRPGAMSRLKVRIQSLGPGSLFPPHQVQGSTHAARDNVGREKRCR